jgi:hypothetical protein
VPPAAWDAGPPRPDEPAPPTAGVRPDFDALPQQPIDLEADAEADLADAAPRPEEPHPTRGIRPDLPPERPPTRPMDTEGGAAPSLPPVRPDRNYGAPGGARPDMPGAPSTSLKK